MSDDALNKNALLALLNGESAPTPKQPSVMRAATTKERISDTLRGFYEWIAKQPLLRATDAIGATDVQGVAKELDGPGRGLQMGMMPEGPGGLKKAIRAFHGSPHDFDKFEMSKIGTGEGAQAYGHGLYFAESPDVARNYRDALSPKATVTSTGRHELPSSLQQADPVKDRAFFDAELQRQRTQLAEWAKSGMDKKDYMQRAVADSNRIIAAIDGALGGAPVQSNGRMYEVDIHADPDDFLDWDAPLNKQSVKVQTELGTRLNARELGLTGSQLHGGVPTGEDIHSRLGMRKNASKYLNEIGIPGIKYFDGGSRAAKEGTRNYVVFDEKLVSIVKKLGVAGALTAGLINESQAKQLKAQGHQ